MGDGVRLKELIDQRGITVRRLAKETGISATTLYSIVQKDTIIRLDNGIRIAAALNIPLQSVCSEEKMPGLEVIGKGKLRYDGFHPHEGENQFPQRLRCGGGADV